MTVWYRLSTISNRRNALRIVGFIVFVIVLITTLLNMPAHAATGTNRTLNFQGKVSFPSGGIIPDGHYNIQFKLYQDGTGTAVGNPGGTLKWTESYVNNGSTGGVQIKNGYMSVNLGSVNPFGNSVDWNQDTLWLSMNIAGSATNCTTFGTSPCGADGEMLPMQRLTAVPYALNAGAVGGKTADNFVQLGQGVQTDTSSNTSSIFINKTNTGNLLQLQSSGIDAFTLTNTGNISFGSNTNHSISIATSAADTDGKQLALSAGTGGAGDGSNGGDLILQGGTAGGTNGTGGNITIDAGAGTGTGTAGSIAIGTTNASSITIGSTSTASDQTITIGSNTAGGSSNVTVGSSSLAVAGSTTIQAKNSVTIATNGTDRATFSDTTNAVYFGNGVSATAPSDYTIQGTNSTAASVSGGSLTVQGGNATTGDTNGGNVVLTGGTGSGNGATGLVVLTTPTFSTATNDANCYTGGMNVANSCTIANSSVDNSSAVLVGFSTAGQTATLPDPTITTAGRILYVMATGDTADFTLSMNADASHIAIRKNTATTLLWNGVDWISASGSSGATLQDAYNNTPQDATSADIVLNATTSSEGLTIRNSATDPVSTSVLSVQNSSSNQMFSINNTLSGSTEYASDGMVHDAASFTANWSSVGSASVSRITTDGQESDDSAQVLAGTSADAGIRNALTTNPSPNSRYRVSAYVKLISGSPFTDYTVRYSPDGGSTFIDCTEYSSQTVLSDTWTKITCSIQTSATTATDPYIYLVQPTTSDVARMYLVDALSVSLSSSNTANVKVGSGTGGDETTVFTLDNSASAPTASDNDALLGSMYYDTTLGKVQCYEAEGWGSCGSSPDNFVTISPEYTNAVMNGTDIGTITSDLCSDTLNINDGSSSQPTICGSNETYNFYKWTSAESTNQTRSIYVTYQLPSTFKEFVVGSTSLLGRTDSANSSVTYQVYRDSSTTGLISCGGTAVSVATGSQSTWQKAVATNGTDPATCGFEPGESILIRINLTAKDDANAYVSNLGFTFSNE